MVSIPALPFRVSLPVPPSILSSPAPPLTTSLPARPVMVSLPCRPLISSSNPCQVIRRRRCSNDECHDVYSLCMAPRGGSACGPSWTSECVFGLARFRHDRCGFTIMWGESNLGLKPERRNPHLGTKEMRVSKHMAEGHAFASGMAVSYLLFDRNQLASTIGNSRTYFLMR